ncbi:MAG: hypothetical protein R3C11_13645 [Planctomycetaceae bacterium]
MGQCSLMQELLVLLFSILTGILLASYTEWIEELSEKSSIMNIKQRLGETIKQRFFTNQSSPIVGFQITTIKGWLETIQFLFELVSHDSVQLVDGVEIKLGPSGKIEYKRTSTSIILSLKPGIQLLLDARIARVKPIATGLIIERNQIQLLLDGFPDVTIGLE